MSCQQKSGVFLNKKCKRTATETCDNCNKKICHVHFHDFEASQFCEDCYWEKYLYALEKKPVNASNDEVYDDRSTASTVISTSSSSTSDSEDEGFESGFGGGEFGGGGASGAWTEGEARGFDETDASGGLFDTDDTFYYS